jgi:hypothetical protein
MLMRISETDSTAPGTYFFNTNGKSGTVCGLAAAGVCFLFGDGDRIRKILRILGELGKGSHRWMSGLFLDS